MVDRLSSLDTSFLHLEDAATPMHVGSVMVFDAPEGGFDYESLVTLISERIAHVPRYRQKIKSVPGGLANPVWVDDKHFDMSYHVRRSALPRPGSDEQLEELVARIQPRPLDRTRPLWEVYLVEGLAEDRFAIITKTHHSLVDGISAASTVIRSDDALANNDRDRLVHVISGTVELRDMTLRDGFVRDQVSGGGLRRRVSGRPVSIPVSGVAAWKRQDC